MRIFGLIGYPLSHSFSVPYFTEKFKRENISDAEYRNFPLENIELFKELIKTKDLAGLNVTIPYKTQIIPFLNELSDGAKEIGAVNTIKIVPSNNELVLFGFNTDEYGFRESLIPHLNNKHNKALILGTGGASKAVEYVLKQLNIAYQIVSRNPKNNNELSYNDLSASVIDEYKLIINTTPLGMYPKIETYPTLAYEAVSTDHIFYDLVYNPEETVFLQKAKEKGANTINGLKMLHLQAERAWQIWNN